MPDNSFVVLREELLRAGVAPRHVRRLLMELQVHYELLVDEELTCGNTVLAAARAAARSGWLRVTGSARRPVPFK
jgi:hypothetical protein